MYTNNWRDSANRIKTLPSGDERQDQSQWAQFEILDSPPEYQKITFHHGSDCELEQAIQECHGVCPWRFLKPPEHTPGQTTLDVPARTGWLDQTTLGGYYNPHHFVFL